MSDDESWSPDDGDRIDWDLRYEDPEAYAATSAALRADWERTRNVDENSGAYQRGLQRAREAMAAAQGDDAVPPDPAGDVERWQSEITPYWTEVGLTLPADISFDDWTALGDGLVQIERNLKWVLGDWFLAGEARFGEDAYQVPPMDAAGETIRKAAWVCQRIPSVRRRTDLTFGHHDAVAALEPAVADTLLDRAAAEGLSVTKLREAVRQHRAVPARSTPVERQHDDGDSEVVGVQVLHADPQASPAAPAPAMCTCPTCGHEHRKADS